MLLLRHGRRLGMVTCGLRCKGCSARCDDPRIGSRNAKTIDVIGDIQRPQALQKGRLEVRTKI